MTKRTLFFAASLTLVAGLAFAQDAPPETDAPAQTVVAGPDADAGVAPQAEAAPPANAAAAVEPPIETPPPPAAETDALTDAATGLNGLLGGILAHYSEMKDALMHALEEGGHDHMSPVGMFMAADWVVKAVMLSLAFASVATWAIFAAKLVQLWSRKRGIKRQYRRLDRAGSLDMVTGSLAKGRGIMGRMVAAAKEETTKSGTDPSLKDGIKERTSSVLSRIEVGAARRMGSGTGILANIGSTAPFVGLFGTVWGIMNSFISIAESNTTNLAVVAPGIAEALLATAIGLVAAIPAVIFYNLLSRGLGGYKIMLGDAAALVERSLSRDLDLRQPQTPAPEAQFDPVQARTPAAIAAAAE